jgi:hypothetical protein
MTDLHSDLEAETTLAGQWFDHLRAHSKSRLGVTRASYGEGEQMAHDLMQAIGHTLGLEQRIDAAGISIRCRRVATTMAPQVSSRAWRCWCVGAGRDASPTRISP